jgi:hypothetical protein
MKLKTVELAAATESLADYACRLAEEPLVVTRAGTPVAVLLPIENADMETVSLSLDPAFNAMLQRSRARYYREGGIPLDEVRREFGLEKAPKGSKAAPAKVGSPPKARRRNS